MAFSEQIKVLAAVGLVSIVPVTAMADTPSDSVPIEFDFIEVGAGVDPNGLWSEEEIEEGGSAVQPSIWYATFPVDGGEASLSILVDKWCGAQECPFRFRLNSDSGMWLKSHEEPAYGMICQDTDSMTVDPIELTVRACGNVIDLKMAR
jgi:hypothetical protein